MLLWNNCWAPNPGLLPYKVRTLNSGSILVFFCCTNFWVVTQNLYINIATHSGFSPNFVLAPISTFGKQLKILCLNNIQRQHKIRCLNNLQRIWCHNKYQWRTKIKCHKIFVTTKSLVPTNFWRRLRIWCPNNIQQFGATTMGGNKPEYGAPTILSTNPEFCAQTICKNLQNMLPKQ